MTTTNKLGIPTDRPCYEPGPNAPKNTRIEAVHGASSGWHVKFGQQGLRTVDIKKNGNEWFWQGLIEGGILIDIHGHDLPTIPGDTVRLITTELMAHIQANNDLSDKGTGAHAIGWDNGFQHALNLVKRLDGFRECEDCRRRSSH